MRIDLSGATTPAEVEAAMASLGEGLGAMRASARRHLVAPERGPDDDEGDRGRPGATCGRPGDLPPFLTEPGY